MDFSYTLWIWFYFRDGHCCGTNSKQMFEQQYGFSDDWRSHLERIKLDTIMKSVECHGLQCTQCKRLFEMEFLPSMPFSDSDWIKPLWYNGKGSDLKNATCTRSRQGHKKPVVIIRIQNKCVGMYHLAFNTKRLCLRMNNTLHRKKGKTERKKNFFAKITKHEK